MRHALAMLRVRTEIHDIIRVGEENRWRFCGVTLALWTSIADSHLAVLKLFQCVAKWFVPGLTDGYVFLSDWNLERMSHFNVTEFGRILETPITVLIENG